MHMNTTSAVVSAIRLFPVRSCAGQALTEAQVTPHGLKFDRRWRLVNAAGRFITQNDCPKMCLIRPSILDSRLQLRFADSDETAPALGDNHNNGPVRISDNCAGIDQGDDIAHWLAAVLGIEVRLLRVTSDSDSDDFARPNMSPVLVISEESLADLNARLSEFVPMDNFRPNYIVRGVKEPYAEESWTRVLIGDVPHVASSELCGRCGMINLDQTKGERVGRDRRNPLKTLAGYRRTADGTILFGKYMVPEKAGIVRVGDNISLLAA
jgi:uncharacterized protein